MWLSKLLSGLVFTAASTVLASAAMAQTDPSAPQAPANPRTLGVEAAPLTFEPNRVVGLPELFNRAFFNESGDFYETRRIPSQIKMIIGPGLFEGARFPDLEIERDARLINVLYQDVLDQQVSSDPVIRTPDLANPFDTSLRVRSRALGYGNRIEGTEYILETPTLR
ncbi:MAG TPA: hypothetical protein V6D33_14800 [Cyanophyceae cyanobacterium]